MNQSIKQNLLETTRKHITHVQTRIQETLSQVEATITKGNETMKSLIRTGQGAEQMVQRVLNAYNKKREQELTLLHPSPYFTRCDVLFPDKKNPETVYIGKFLFTEEAVYSWVTPIATLRYESPGIVTYRKTDGTRETVQLLRKDQYMIVDGQVVFFATENTQTPRTLVYQEHFSRKKDGFVLPEIVEQMEKAQDQVIRAHPKGPFVISGPAGSGKTTLALHRVAYLAQAPDSAEFFPGNSTIVFVQDVGTKRYFSHLLPELGIHDVTITTFAEWSISVLDSRAAYVTRIGASETEKDEYEWQKLQALRKATIPAYTPDLFYLLEKIYQPYFSPQQQKLLATQKKENIMDRFDLTILLRSYHKTHGHLDRPQEYFVQRKNFEVTRKKGRFPIEYTLMVVDEFQNYLPEQILLLKQCVQERFRSMVYVGDMAQQIHLGTIREWSEVHETISEERKVMLQKVYRNTRQILEYIQSLGFTVTIPKELKNGPKVEEKICSNPTGEIEYIQQILTQGSYESVGILVKDGAYLLSFRKALGENKAVHLLTMAEAQGVEFDVVFIVGITREMFSIPSELPELLQKEKQRTQKDLLYVALTRAIRELHVVGHEKLSDVINEKAPG